MLVKPLVKPLVRPLLRPFVGSGLGGYDINALDYFSRAGVIDPVARYNWNIFFKGLKSLNAWNSLVSGLVFPYGYNTSSGTIVQNIKGATGTLVNGPSRVAAGLQLSGAGCRVETTNPLYLVPTVSMTAMWFGDISGDADTVRPAQLYSSGNADWNQRFTNDLYVNGASSMNRFRLRTTVGYLIDHPQTLAQILATRCNVFQISSSVFRGHFIRVGDAGFQSTSSLNVLESFTPEVQQLWLGDNTTYTGQFYNGIYSGMLMFNAAVDFVAIYSLAKSTILKGLLP